MAEARDRYVFIKKLAEGGMADVFLARDEGSTPPRLCVVKQLLPHLRSRREHVAMFLDEADLAMNLAHPSVVRAFDRGTGRDGPFLVLEYLAGFDLDLVLERLRSVGAQLPWPLAVQVIIASAGAMAYAHELKGADGKPLHLIHRDLTPSNIFLTFDGVVKVLDFGIARAEERRTRTSTGMLKGKARYLAPELIQQLPGDGRVDQFSLGAALYECLTLEPLAAGDNELAVIHAIVEGRRPDLKALRPDVPDEVVPLRDDCLQALTRLSGDQQLGAHWTMAMATYPFFVEVVSAVGRLLALQETVALNQVTRRIAEKWGERSTAVRACRRVVRSIVRWGALRDTTKHGVYARRIVPVPTEPSDFQLLAEGLLRGQGAEAAALDDLSASPALFLFSLPNVGSRAFGSGRLSYSREGVDREMVVLTSQPELASRPAAENRVNAGRTRSTE
mgnify:CR=1 FL=1